MPKFELKFETALFGCIRPPTEIYDWQHERVIVASSLDEAKAIAAAMLEEEVASYEFLVKIKSVELTDKAPGIFVFDGGKYCWERVLERLATPRSQVEWIEAKVGGQKEIVGFKKK